MTVVASNDLNQQRPVTLRIWFLAEKYKHWEINILLAIIFPFCIKWDIILKDQKV